MWRISPRRSFINPPCRFLFRYQGQWILFKPGTWILTRKFDRLSPATRFPQLCNDFVVIFVLIYVLFSPLHQMSSTNWFFVHGWTPNSVATVSWRFGPLSSRVAFAPSKHFRGHWLERIGREGNFSVHTLQPYEMKNNETIKYIER